MKTGIYVILNLINGKRYIGQSSNIEHSLEAHRAKLVKNKHQNECLQLAWIAYGPGSFVFETLEECEESKLSERQTYWIAQYQATDTHKGYNQGLNIDGLKL